jgi:glucosamine--fructose-6-phosphate aminotransferase (isomerizing)
MCGIVAILTGDQQPEPGTFAAVCAALDAALDVLSQGSSAPALARASEPLARADRSLCGPRGVIAVLAEPGGIDAVARLAGKLEDRVAQIEQELDSWTAGPDELEQTNAGLAALRDLTWSITKDRLSTAAAVDLHAGPAASPASRRAWWAIESALRAIDRLEVRGRDSSGLHVLVSGHAIDLDEASVRARAADPLLRSGAVRVENGHLAFVFKVAAEIGELGDNTRALRAALESDDLLRRALASAPGVCTTVLGHTRWASVGLISEPNAHPLDSDERDGAAGPYYVAALNGDIDNHAELRVHERVTVAREITTDAKLIPVLVARARAGGLDEVESFRSVVDRFSGSVAIAANGAERARRLMLALRGSGQALHIGLADDAFVVASEPYGLVEHTSSYLRLEGSPGQVVVLDGSAAGRLDGIRRLSYDGVDAPVGRHELKSAEITTRDIDRRGARHFLLKEILESPQSVRKTLRGKIVTRGGRLEVALPAETLPDALREALRAGRIRRVLVAGQGTAAIAARSVATAVGRALAPRAISAEAMTASELSGFGMSDEMSDTLVVAISQSGTTVDTNRTVDLVRARGALVIAVVNRRNSELVEKSDAVLYTSDGRDVEMAVPSTKAFYAQVAAGFLLAFALSDVAGCPDASYADESLRALQAIPAAMDQVLADREHIARAAAEHAPPRRYWTIVGNGLNRIAAEELRIKLSELCYKSISCDSTEDKKHIDLCTEPFILVCASGLEPSTADDVAKEVAIYRAHKAAPVVIATSGDDRFAGALDVITVPATHPSMAFLLSAVAGHLFGYEAAVAIDAQARVLREARAALEVALSAPADELLPTLADLLRPIANRFSHELVAGSFNGSLEPSTAVRLSSLFGYATGLIPLDAYEAEHGKLASPAELVADVAHALTKGIDELTRTIDSIKHQAKTVTVGITRSEEAYFESPLVREVLAAGAPRDRLGYRALRTLAELDAGIEEVTGFTRYEITGDPSAAASIHVLATGGVAAGIPSRTASNPELRGTKRRAAAEREVTVARGRSDGRTLVIVPEAKGSQVTGLTLLHTQFRDRLEPAAARRLLSAYRGRYTAIVDAVRETEPDFSDGPLGEIPLIDLLVEPVNILADRWRSA